MKFRILLIIFILILFGTTSIFANSNQPFFVEHSVTPNQGLIGDTFTYQISIHFASQKKPEIIPAPKLKQENFIIKDFSTGYYPSDTNKSVLTYKYVFTTFKTGAQTIPSKNIKIKSENKVLTYLLPDLALTIKSLLPKDPNKIALKDISGPFMVPFPIKSYLYLFLILLLIAGFSLILFLLYKRFYKPKSMLEKIQAPVDTRTPAEIALSEIEALKQKGLISKGKLKEHYLCLSEIIKAYLAKIYSQKMLELTSTEILDILEQKLDQQLFRKIAKFFNSSDLIKFAKLKPSDTEHNENLGRVLTLIERTKEKDAVS
ncbi:hypothetical protein ACFL2K_01675 [Candidatus Margulisiibacteriota bacterium]